jgi:hypothetical protein
MPKKFPFSFSLSSAVYKYLKSPLLQEQFNGDVEGFGWLENTDPIMASFPQEMQFGSLPVKFLKVPVGQMLQSPRSRKWPSGHKQSISVYEEPSKPVERNPGKHVQLEPPSGDVCLSGQRSQTSLPLLVLYFPGSQSKQSAEEIPENFPLVHKMQLARFDDA